MLSSTTAAHADFFLRLAELPIPPHERELARSQAQFAFRLVDLLCDAANDARAGFASLRRGARRLQRAH